MKRFIDIENNIEKFITNYNRNYKSDSIKTRNRSLSLSSISDSSLNKLRACKTESCLAQYQNDNLTQKKSTDDKIFFQSARKCNAALNSLKTQNGSLQQSEKLVNHTLKSKLSSFFLHDILKLSNI